ncbi:hypothetical protein ACLKA7_017321 [Drosophila subpalustris]
MLFKALLLTLTIWLTLLCAGSLAKPHLLATTPVGYATAGGTWLTAATAPVATLGAAYYPAYAAYTYTPVYYGAYATYPYYTYLRR